jgi:hypothetical protein
MENPYSKGNIIKGSIISALFLLILNFIIVRQYQYPYIIALKDSLGSLLFWTIGAVIIGNTIRYYLPLQNRIYIFWRARFAFYSNMVFWYLLFASDSEPEIIAIPGIPSAFHDIQDFVHGTPFYFHGHPICLFKLAE